MAERWVVAAQDGVEEPLLLSAVAQPKHGFDGDVLFGRLMLVEPECLRIEPRIGKQVAYGGIRVFHETAADQVAAVSDAGGLAVPRDQQQAGRLDRTGGEDEGPRADTEPAAGQRRTVDAIHAPVAVGEVDGGGMQHDIDIFGLRKVDRVAIELGVLAELEITDSTCSGSRGSGDP